MSRARLGEYKGNSFSVDALDDMDPDDYDISMHMIAEHSRDSGV